MRTTPELASIYVWLHTFMPFVNTLFMNTLTKLTVDNSGVSFIYA